MPASEYLTIAEAARRIRARELSPVELVRACLDRIERLDGAIHAFIHLDAERVLDQARAAEAEILARGPRGPLHGIPVGLKDIFETRGIPTTAHSRQLVDHVPREDSTVTARLAGAGAVMMGKLATHEFAFGGPSFDLPWPPARNPWDTARMPGGSSSGPAAAVAAGMVPGAMGSDTAGSIRSPASFCGIAGLKPTYGLVSRRGVLPLAFSLDHAGPMAWTAEDCAMLLQAIAGHDEADPASAERPVPDYTVGLSSSIAGVRVGVVRHFYEADSPVSEDARKAIEAAVDVLRDLGASVREVRLSPLADWHAAGFLILLAEAYAVHETWLCTRPDRYGELMRQRTALGATVTSADYVQAQRRRRELIAELDAVMQRTDILVGASQTGEAPRIDAVPKWAPFLTSSYNVPFNLSGSPALSVCCGYGAGGLPLGVQLAGRPFEDALVLRVGHAYEQATAWRGRRPPAPSGP